MLNKEKYKDRIFEIACEGEMIAGKPICNRSDCRPYCCIKCCKRTQY